MNYSDLGFPIPTGVAEATVQSPGSVIEFWNNLIYMRDLRAFQESPFFDIFHIQVSDIHGASWSDNSYHMTPDTFFIFSVLHEFGVKSVSDAIY